MTYWITEGPNNMGANASTNGYTVLPGGTIMQWGRLPGNHDGAWHNFPTPFPNVCYNVVVTPHASAMNNDFENRISVRSDEICFGLRLSMITS